MSRIFRKIKVADRDLSFVQDNIGNTFAPILKVPIINGVLVKDVVLATGSNQFAHTLDRQPQGYLIVDQQAAATIYRTAWSDKTLTLSASADTTVSLWVF